MHDSPFSRINNLDLWKKYDHKTLGIIGDPYLDVDYYPGVLPDRYRPQMKPCRRWHPGPCGARVRHPREKHGAS
jgi:hypothetical protein